MNNPFKGGDRVHCIEGERGVLTKGKTYVIDYVDDEFVAITANDRGIPQRGWYASRFEAQETGCFIVVARDSTGSSSGGCVSGQFETLEDASKYAEDEAFDHCLSFIVFKAVKGITRSTREFSV